MATKTNLVDYEQHNDDGMINDYRKDISADSHNERIAILSQMKREWAIVNGNDSGFDLYD